MPQRRDGRRNITHPKAIDKQGNNAFFRHLNENHFKSNYNLFFLEKMVLLWASILTFLCHFHLGKAR